MLFEKSFNGNAPDTSPWSAWMGESPLQCGPGARVGCKLGMGAASSLTEQAAAQQLDQL